MVLLDFDIMVGRFIILSAIIQKLAAVTPQNFPGAVKKSRCLVKGLLRFGLFAALFGGDISILFLGQITAGNDWLLEMVNQFAHKIIHVLSLIVAL